MAYRCDFQNHGRESSIYATSYVSNSSRRDTFFIYDFFFFFAAYGEFNDDTIVVVNTRNQQLVKWDFGYANFFLLVRSITFAVFLPVLARETRRV